MPAFGKRNVETKRTAFAPAAATRTSPLPETEATDSVREASPSASAARPTRVPYLSLAIFAVLCAAYWAELAYGVDASRALAPSHRTIIALGGLSGQMVRAGEWWRIFTGPLLHGNVLHLISNGFALILAGYYLEPLIGRRWFAGVYVLGSMGGALGSITLNAPDTVTVGASGAIMGLLGATLICSYADVAGEKHARRMRWIAIRLLVPSLIPIATAGGPQVDYSAHLGGALAGGLAGFALQIFWPEESDRPSHASVAMGLAASGAVASLLSLFLVAQSYSVWAVRGNDMIPDALLPAKDADAIAQSGTLTERYPHDPRGHFFRALYFLDAHDLADAEEHLRTALSEREALEAETSPEFQQVLRIVLAVTLVGESHDSEAKILSASDCRYAGTRVDMAKGLELLQKAGVCP
jgi:rhomboid protease GluP